MQSKYTYLSQRGVFDPSSAEYKIAEKEYFRLYRNEWSQKNKQHYHRVSILFPMDDYDLIKKHALSHNIPVARFIRNASVSACNGHLYLPAPELLPKAITAINRIGNLINQQTRWIHTNQILTEQHYQELLNQMKQLRENLSQLYRHDM